MSISRELAHETWDEYFDAVGRELLDSPVSIEGGDPSPASARLSLISLREDRGAEVLELSLRAATDDVRRLVLHPRRVAIDNQTLLAPMTIAVDGRDGSRTLIRFEREPEIWS